MALFAKRWFFQTSVFVHNMTSKEIEFCQNYPPRFLFQIKDWPRKETQTYQGREHLLRKKFVHYSILVPSVSVGCADWLLFLRLSTTTDAWIDRKAAFTRFVLLKPLSQQNPLLFLKIQAWNEIIWFEIDRADHWTPRRLDGSLLNALHVSLLQNRPIAFYVSSLQADHL